MFGVARTASTLSNHNLLLWYALRLVTNVALACQRVVISCGSALRFAEVLEWNAME
jgi:hypothetical protein